MLETLVALAVIIAAVVGPISLITAGLSDFSTAKNRIIASHLSQEGIELIRHIVETNVICDALDAGDWQWNRRPENPGGPLFSDTTVALAVDPGRMVDVLCGGNIMPNIPKLDDTACLTKNLKLDQTTGQYGYDPADPASIFNRCVRVIAYSGAGDTNPVDGIPDIDEMDIISTVVWNEKGVNRSITLSQRIYDWR